jgi:AraC-like DNA-binding protein
MVHLVDGTEKSAALLFAFFIAQPPRRRRTGAGAGGQRALDCPGNTLNLALVAHPPMQHDPHPLLAGLIKSVWLSTPDQTVKTSPCERILPTGEMHLVFRLSGPSICIFDDNRPAKELTLGHAVVGGARAGFYTKEVAADSLAIGVQLLPGAAQALLGMPADELTGQHARLDDLWGKSAGFMREQLLAASLPADRIHRFQMLLLARLRSAQAPVLHPAVKRALAQFKAGASVQDAVAQSGYSHRQFIRVFSQAVGLPPKLYCRVQRFQHALGLIQRVGVLLPLSLPEVALDAGYSDQSHFNREFREFSGLTPEQYRLARVMSPNHVPVLAQPRTDNAQ